MPKVYQANNVEEAVEMAAKFKDDGTYNWFRGQTCDWPPHSSMYRIKQQPDLIAGAEEDYQEFVAWTNQKPELKHLLEPGSVHQLEAILQHYGFPTDYIDFSLEPSVAGFFASDTQTPPTACHSCIYCLSIDDLMDMWNTIKNFDSRKEVAIEKVVIGVENLWRLQAQQGVFLKATYNWDIDYPMDKIIFPYTGYPSFPPKERIYPVHKSALEKLLDEYFDRRRSQKAIRELEPLFETVNIISELPNGYHSGAFHRLLTPLPSWSNDHLAGWKSLPVEDFALTSGFIQKINLHGKQTPQEVRIAVSYAMKHLQRSDTGVRSRAIDWVIEGGPAILDSAKAGRLIVLIWNAMRTLPYTGDEIAEACGNTLFLQMKNFGMLNLQQQSDLFSEMTGAGFRVGFSIKEGNGATGWLSRESFDGFIRADLAEQLTDEFRHFADKPRSLFSIVYNPSLIFDFDRFKTAFAKEIIPAEIAIYESFVLFNPANLAIFGNP